MKFLLSLILTALICNPLLAKNTRDDNEYSISEVLSLYSKTSKTKIFVDPRVKGMVRFYGQKLNEITFSDLLTMLNLRSYTAYKSGGDIIVIPTVNSKSFPIQLIKEGKTYPADLLVTDIVKVEKICVEKILPKLRPLIPQQGYITAYPAAKTITMISTFANVSRVREIIQRLDDILKKPEKCEISKKK